MSTRENSPTGSILDAITDDAPELLSGVPTPIKRNFFKACSQLCTAAVDIPVSVLEGKAAENRAETAARIELIKVNQTQIAEQMKVSPVYAQAAVEKFGQKILKEQLNLDHVVSIAKEELSNAEFSAEEMDNNESVNEDWLNSFEKEAVLKSSDEMKMLFGKILAGEIKKPSTFSIRTLKLLGQLDNNTAKLFQKLCSISISQRYGNSIHDARGVAVSGMAGQNGLQKYGLGFDQLNILHEYGLIISDYNSNMPYDVTIIQSNTAYLPLIYGNRKYGLVWNSEQPRQADLQLKLSGVAFSQAGKELLSIVEITRNDSYTEELVGFLKQKKFDLVTVE